MNAHELARRLLELPDLPVVFETDEEVEFEIAGANHRPPEADREPEYRSSDAVSLSYLPPSV
jgi:hypothetical protein